MIMHDDRILIKLRNDVDISVYFTFIGGIYFAAPFNA
jgi:hypothetical protein